MHVGGGGGGGATIQKNTCIGPNLWFEKGGGEWGEREKERERERGGGKEVNFLYRKKF